MRHVKINQEAFEDRAIDETCDFCNSRPGEPCRAITNDNQFCCPDPDCNQRYNRAFEALECQLHIPANDANI